LKFFRVDGKRAKYASQSSTTCDHAGRLRRDCWAIRGRALVWRYPPTSEWITGRTIYSKPLSGGALQIYERRRPFNRLAQSSLTAVVKLPFPRLSSTPLSVTLTELHLASVSPSAWLDSPAVLACQPFILYRSESVRFGPNIKGDVLASARDRDAKSLRYAILVLFELRTAASRVSSR